MMMPHAACAPLVLVLSTIFLSSASAFVVDDSDKAIKYDASWAPAPNGDELEGSSHRTNVTGASASYQFQGTSVAIYGATHSSGAKFSAVINNIHDVECTCFSNDSNVVYFQTQLCTLTALNATNKHTITITHIDTAGLWLNFDFFDIVFSDSGTTATSTTVPTPLPSTIGSPPKTQTTSHTRTSSSSSPSTSSSHSSSSNIGPIVGGVVGGVLLLALVALGAFWFIRRRRATRPGEVRLESHGGTPPVMTQMGMGGETPGAFPPMMAPEGTFAAGGVPVYAGSLTNSGASGSGVHPASHAYLPPVPGLTPTTHSTTPHPNASAHPYYDTSILHQGPLGIEPMEPESVYPPSSSYAGTQAPPSPPRAAPVPVAAALPTQIERAPRPPQPLNTPARMEALYPGSVGPSVSVPRSSSSTTNLNGNTYQSLALDERDEGELSTPPSASPVSPTNPRPRDSTFAPVSSSMFAQNQMDAPLEDGASIDGWRSVLGSPPPPSYRTRQYSGRRPPLPTPGGSYSG